MKASSIRLDAIGVVLAPGQEPSVTQFPQRLVSSLGSAADHLCGRCRRHGLKAGMRAQIAIPGLAYPLRLLGPTDHIHSAKATGDRRLTSGPPAVVVGIRQLPDGTCGAAALNATVPMWSYLSPFITCAPAS